MGLAATHLNSSYAPTTNFTPPIIHFQLAVLHFYLENGAPTFYSSVAGVSFPKPDDLPRNGRRWSKYELEDTRLTLHSPASKSGSQLPVSPLLLEFRPRSAAKPPPGATLTSIWPSTTFTLGHTRGSAPHPPQQTRSYTI